MICQKAPFLSIIYNFTAKRCETVSDSEMNLITSQDLMLAALSKREANVNRRGSFWR